MIYELMHFMFMSYAHCYKRPGTILSTAALSRHRVLSFLYLYSKLQHIYIEPTLKLQARNRSRESKQL